MPNSNALDEVAKAATVEHLSANSDNIFEGLEAMLVQFAQKTWMRIPESHRRHMDFDDVMQETRLRAWYAIRSYKPSMKTKLSTWVFNTLTLRMREVNAPFTDPKRNAARSAPVISLDSSDDHLDTPPGDWLVSHNSPSQDVLSAFEVAYASGNSSIQQMFLDALGFRVRVPLGQATERKRALDILVQCRLTQDDFHTLRATESERCILVAAKHSKNSSQIVLPKIECKLCDNSFSIDQVGKTIDAKTLVCSNCYEQQAKNAASCFAKMGQYDPNASECKPGRCPDRVMCSTVSTQGEFMGIKLAKESSVAVEDDPFLDDDTGSDNSVGALTIGSEQLDFQHDETPDGSESDDEDDFEEDGYDAVYDDGDDGDEDDEPAEPALTIKTVASAPDEIEDDPFDLPDSAAVESAKTPKPEPESKTPAPKPSRQKAQETPVASVTKSPMKVAVSKTAAPVVPIKPAKTVAVSKSVTKAPAEVKTGPRLVSKEPVKVEAKAPAKAVAKTAAKAPPKVAAKTVAKAPAKAPAKAAKATPVKAAAKTKAEAPVRAKRVLKAFKPQYWAGETPFRPGTHLQIIVERLMAETGLKMTNLAKYVEKNDLNFRGVKHTLMKGKNYNGQFEWKFVVTGEGTAQVGHLKITKKPSAEFRKACLSSAPKA